MAEKTSVPVKESGARISRWNPFEQLDALQDDMMRLWGHAWHFRPSRFTAPLAQLMSTWMPQADIFVKNGNFIVKADLPGVKKEDVQVALEEGDLIIRGERNAESEVKEENYYRMERSYGSFYRRVPLLFEAHAEQIQATYVDGVLEIIIPKPAEQKPEAKKIAIK